MKSFLLVLTLLLSSPTYASEECESLKAIDGKYMLTSQSEFRITAKVIKFFVDGCRVKTSNRNTIIFDGMPSRIGNDIFKAEILPLAKGWNKESLMRAIKGTVLKLKVTSTSLGNSYVYDKKGAQIKTNKRVFILSLNKFGDLESLVKVYDGDGKLIKETLLHFERLEQ